MNLEAKCDDRGRIYLREEIRNEFGNRFYVVPARGEVLLIPIPKDPLKHWQELGKKLPKDKSVKQLITEAREMAEEEAVGNIERLRRK